MTTLFPTLVFSSEEEREQWNFFNVVDKTNQIKSLPGLDVRSTDLYMSSQEDGGWLLLRDRDSQQLFLFNLTSLQRIFVPPLDEDDFTKFTFLLPYPPSHPHSSLVAVNVSERYWLQFSPGSDARQFTKQTFPDDVFCRGTATTFQRKVVFHARGSMHLIDPVSGAVENLKTSYSTDHNGPTGCFDVSSMLIEADGDLFKVNWNTYSDSYALQSIDVFKLALPSREWVQIDNIGGRVFFMGRGFSVACSASTRIRGNRIYFVDFTDEQRLCCYDLDLGRLTTYLPCPGNDDGGLVPPCWVILNQAIEEKLMTSDEVSTGEENLMTPDKFSTGKGLEIILKEKLVLDESSTAAPAPQEKTPCLLFTHKNDGMYTLVDPFTKAHKTLHLPQLSQGCILYSSPLDGWMAVRQSMEAGFLFNLLTTELIQLPSLEEAGLLYHMALASPPHTPDCMVFGLAVAQKDGITEIVFCRLGDPEWTKLSFPNKEEDPFSPAHTNAVFYKGMFHCLGMNGELGVFDHSNQTWSVRSIEFDEDLLRFWISQCFLFESEGKLWCVLMDEYDYPGKVYRLNNEMNKWEKVSDFGDRLLFLGRYASFFRASPDEESKNSICLQRFTEEDDYEGTTINPWEHDYSQETMFYESTEYTLNPCWVEVHTNIFNTAPVGSATVHQGQNGNDLI